DLSLHCFFFNDTATTEIYTLSLHDALPIYRGRSRLLTPKSSRRFECTAPRRSEEHTSELQSHHDLVFRLLLEKEQQGVPFHAYIPPTIVLNNSQVFTALPVP